MLIFYKIKMNSSRIDYETFINNLENSNSPLHKFLKSKQLYVITENIKNPKKKKPKKLSLKPKRNQERENKIFNESENMSKFYNSKESQTINEEDKKVDTKIMLKKSYEKFFEMSKDNMYTFPSENKKKRKINYLISSRENTLNTDRTKNIKNEKLPQIAKKIYYYYPNESFENTNKQKILFKKKNLNKRKNRIYNINNLIPDVSQNTNLNKFLFYEMNDYYNQQRKIFK